MWNVLPVDISFKRGISAPFWRLFDKIGPLLLLAVVLLAVTAVRPTLLTGANLLTIGLQASVNALLAIGQTLVIIAGGIDLSVGTMMSLSMVAMALSTTVLGVPMPLGMVIAVALGLLGGGINGFLIAYGRIPAFIVTLGMLGIAQGTALKLSGGYSMYGFPDWYEFIANGDLLGIPFPIWIVAVAAIVAHYVFTQRPLGRYAFAMGASEESVRRQRAAAEGQDLPLLRPDGRMRGNRPVVADRFGSSWHRTWLRAGRHCRVGHRRGKPDGLITQHLERIT